MSVTLGVLDWGIGGLDFHARLVARVPTLVVTSGTSDIYDEVAQVLASHGASRLILGGYGHRVQDHPEASAAFQQFWSSLG